MLRNYLLTAIRVLKKNSLFSLINILGLAIGLAASIIIYLWVYDELSYDEFHTNADRIYRLERDMELEGDRMMVSITSPPLGPQLLNDYPSVESFVRIAGDNIMVEDLNKTLNKESLFYVDNSFFSVFSFPIIEGDVVDCLKDPFTIAISESYARKYFGEMSCVGRSLNVNYNGQIRPYKITAIFKDFPHNSHLQTDLIGSFQSLYSIRHEMMMTSWMASNLYTYIVIAENTDISSFENELQNVVDKYFGPDIKQFLSIDNPRDFMLLALRPVTDIHLYADRVWEMETPGSKTSVLVFSLVAVLLLVIAGINFMNLSTARASRRALEVGVRKTSGATKAQLVRQFLSESALFSFLALILALFIVEFTLPAFSVFTDKDISLKLLAMGWNPLLTIAAWLILAFFAGAYPAFFLSKYKPIEVLKGNKSANGSHLFRKALVVGQFAISIGLIICSISVYRHLQYINNKDLGYNRFGLIDIRIDNRANYTSYSAFKDDLLAIPEVQSVSRSMTVPATRGFSDNPHMLRGNPDPFFPVINRADDQFIPTFQIPLRAGANFTPEMIGDTSVYYIINDAARKMFGFESEFDALGQEVGLLAGQNRETRNWGPIVGVAEDFHFQPLTEHIKPMVISSSQIGHNHISIRVDDNATGVAKEKIKEVWQKHYPNQIFASSFVSQNFDRLHLTERRLQVILLIFTGLAIFVACLGLLGLSAFTVEQRMKEIGIRKTMGARSVQIILLISKEFSRLVIVSCMIAMPLAYFIIREWLNIFPYRQGIELWVFIIAAVVGWSAALLTVFIQTYRASRQNPVDIIKYE